MQLTESMDLRLNLSTLSVFSGSCFGRDFWEPSLSFGSCFGGDPWEPSVVELEVLSSSVDIKMLKSSHTFGITDLRRGFGI